MRSTGNKRGALIIVGVMVALPNTEAAARPTVRSSATAAAGLAYERNPFLLDADGADAASAQLTLTPRLEITDIRTNATVTGYYNRNEYLSKYDGTDAAAVSIDGSSQLNSRLSVGSSIRFDSSILGANNSLAFNRGLNGTGLFTPVNVDEPAGPGTGGLAGSDLPLPLISDQQALDAGSLGGDIGLVGRRQRRNLLFTSLTTAYRPGPRGTWTLGVNAERTWYPGGGRIAESYRSAGASFGYNQAISETATLGAQISGNQVDYDRGRRTRIYSPQATFSKRLTRGWSINVAAGASFVQSNDVAVVSGSDNGTSLSVQLGFCRNGAKSNLCLSLNRTPSANGASGVNTASSAQASYNIRLNARSSLSTYASYSRNETDQQTVFVGNDQEFVAAGTSYNWQLSQRLSVVASAQYRDIRFTGRAVQPDLSARLGLSVFFGQIQ